MDALVRSDFRDCHTHRGLEWLHNETQIGPNANNKYRSGNQVALSARYDF